MPFATAADPGSTLFSDVLPVTVGLVVVVLVGAALIYVARRAARGESGGPAGFSLQDLRELHRSGQLSDDEFERAKRLMIGRITGSQEGAEPLEQDR